jgi:outer membrane protein OmpA-like peptidoglycan-associated protein
MISSRITARAGAVGVLLTAGLAILPAQAASPSTLKPGASTATTHPAAGSDRRLSRQGNIGLFSGLALGAAAGGPIGAVVGATAGAWLGERYHRELTANQALAGRLRRSERAQQHLDARAKRLATTLAASRKHSAELTRTLRLSDELETDVAFRTGNASVDRSDLKALRRLGALAASLPGVTVHVDGYADPRGPEDLNDDLSLLRAEAVALVLARAGCPTRRLLIEGHGSSESASPAGDLDAYALDRRVTVRLERTRAGEVASRD